MVATTLTDARRKLGWAVGGYQVLVAQAGTNTTLQAGWLPSTAKPATAYAYEWVYCPDSVAPKLAQVTQSGLDTVTGTLTVDRFFGTAVALNTVFELSSRLPPGRDSGVGSVTNEADVLSLNDCVNLALRHILVDDTEVLLPLVNTQRIYSLADWPWLDRADRLREVRQPDALSINYLPTSRIWEFHAGARYATLRFRQPFRFSSGSYSVKLDVRRPADTLIQVAGIWGDSTVGLVNESDACAVDLNSIETVGLAFAYRALRDRYTGSARARYADLYVDQLHQARRVHGYDHSNDIDPSVPAGPAAVAPTPEGAMA